MDKALIAQACGVTVRTVNKWIATKMIEMGAVTKVVYFRPEALRRMAKVQRRKDVALESQMRCVARQSESLEPLWTLTNIAARFRAARAMQGDLVAFFALPDEWQRSFVALEKAARVKP